MLGEGPGVVFDLGSGGGLPALPAALAEPGWTWVLVESQLRRADQLASATRRLVLQDRVTVMHARAEEVGRDPKYRGTADAVTARAFGPPAVVAECSAPLLRVGGRLLVSEPPEADERWPEAGLGLVGLSPAVARSVSGYAFVEVTQAEPCPRGYPRRPRVSEKSPLF